MQDSLRSQWPVRGFFRKMQNIGTGEGSNSTEFWGQEKPVSWNFPSLICIRPKALSPKGNFPLFLSLKCNVNAIIWARNVSVQYKSIQSLRRGLSSFAGFQSCRNFLRRILRDFRKLSKYSNKSGGLYETAVMKDLRYTKTNFPTLLDKKNGPRFFNLCQPRRIFFRLG